ncbi:glycosyltransferase [bacterium]|nr:glycosyltransferase [bacterium]
MNIALVTPYAEYPGGVETVNRLLSQIFVDAGHTVQLITADNGEGELHLISSKLIGLPAITAKRFNRRANEFDVVIANGEFSWGLHHPRIINLFHGCYKGYRDYLRPVLNTLQYINCTRLAWLQKMAAREKTLVCVSEFIKGILENDGCRVSAVISNCVDTVHFSPPEVPTRNGKYLFVGSYNRYGKGFDILEGLANRGLDIDCITNANPGNLLNWLPGRENSQMVDIYRSYSTLIFPSRFEGMPMVPLEAMACGMPILTSNVGLGPELKKHIPEFVIEGDGSDKIEKYSEKLSHILKHYDVYSRKARDYVLKFHSYEEYKKKWLALLTEVKNA